MSPRTTGILVLVAAALGAFVYFYEVQGRASRTEAEEREKRLFADVEPADIAWIEVTLQGAAPARIVSARTDRMGRVRLPLDGAGMWLVKAVHVTRGSRPRDWNSLWASLTFEVPP